jgi:hypothetical protein
MQAEIVLTPTESKKLISMAALQLPEVQGAIEKGGLVIHPRSTAVFLCRKE